VRQKRRRLSRSAEFDRVYRHGRSTSSRYLVLYAFPRERSPEPDREAQPEQGETGTMRLGVSVGRRVGSAVMRNRVKRLLREAFWSLDDSLAVGHDYVIVARPDAGGLAEREGLAGLERDLDELVAKLRPQEGDQDDAR
jgi:ribonuclease P protein component